MRRTCHAGWVIYSKNCFLFMVTRLAGVVPIHYDSKSLVTENNNTKLNSLFFLLFCSRLTNGKYLRKILSNSLIEICTSCSHGWKTSTMSRYRRKVLRQRLKVLLLACWNASFLIYSLRTWLLIIYCHPASHHIRHLFLQCNKLCTFLSM